MIQTTKSSLLKCCMAILAFAAFCFLTPSPVSAQEISGAGTVSGVVTDESGPVIGAAVMIKDRPDGGGA